MSRVVVALHRTSLTVVCLLALAGCPVNVDTSALKNVQQQTPQNQMQQPAGDKPASNDAQDEGDGDAPDAPPAHEAQHGDGDAPEMGGQHDMPPPQELGDAGLDQPPPARMCDEQITSGCCGDTVCDGPETHDNCAADCDEGEVALPAPPPPDGGVPPGDGEQPPPDGQQPPDGGVPPGDGQQPPAGGIPMCSDAQTTKCCGDTICGGPETHDNCPADCDVGEVALPPVGQH